LLFVPDLAIFRETMEQISCETLRIVDANLNRAGEGLRFLEEIARLSLNDPALTQQLKTLRHDIVQVDLQLQQQLLNARDSAGDVGADMGVPGEENQREIPAAIIANSRRVQESLRVLEEISKSPEMPLDSEKYKKARFDLYAIEKTLLSAVTRQDKLNLLYGLYAVVDSSVLKGRSHLEVAAQLIKGGAKTIQLRDKTIAKKDLIAIAQSLAEMCAQNHVLFIMNDYLDVALAVGADGLHVGQEDLPVSVARRLLPIDKILGCSTCTVAEARLAQSQGADYVAVGAMYATPTKDECGVVGTSRLEQVKKAVNLPLVAIGGINHSNVREVMAAGADSVAVISALLGAADVEQATRQMIKIIEGVHLE
jgi:thiamine-phosphate pyrophosphorylase